MPSTSALQTLALQYASLKRNSPTGLYCIPSIASILNWDCVLFVHQGVLSFIVSTCRLLTRLEGYYAGAM